MRSILLWNAEGLTPFSEKNEELAELMAKEGCGIVGITETFWRGDVDIVAPAGFTGVAGEVYHSGEGRVRRGVALLWKGVFNMEPLPDNKYSCLVGAVLRGAGRGNDMYLAVFYADPADGSQDYGLLAAWVKKWKRRGAVLVLGDFNTSANRNAICFRKLLVSEQLVDVGGMLGSKYTTKKRTRIDRILVSAGTEFRFSNLVVHEGLELQSHHFPLSVSLEWDRTAPQDSIAKGCQVARLGIFEADEVQKERYANLVGEQLQGISVEGRATGSTVGAITRVLIEAADSVFPKRAVVLPGVARPRVEVQSIVRAKREAYRWSAAAEQSGDHERSRKWKAEARKLKRRANNLARTQHRLQTSRVGERLSSVDKLFKFLNRHKQYSTLGRVIVNDKGEECLGRSRADALASFYSAEEPSVNFDAEHLAEVQSELQVYLSAEVANVSFTEGELNCEFTLADVQAALNRLQLRKAEGSDGISPFMLKWSTEPVQQLLCNLFNEVLVSGEYPSRWKESVVSVLHKRGEDAVLPKSYRPIYLIAMLSKVILLILLKRASGVIEKRNLLPETQNGFRSARGCEDSILTLIELCEFNKFKKLLSFVAFIDFKNAFPSTWRAALFLKLFQALGVNRVTKLIYDMYQGDRFRVRVPEGLSQWKDISIGVRTGDPLSPLLYLLFIADLLLELERLGYGIRLPCGRTVPGVMLADDLVLVSESASVLQSMLSYVSRYAEKWRLRFSTHKCGVMVYGKTKKSLLSSDDGIQFFLGGEMLPLVSDYKYLGVIFESNCAWVKQAAKVTQRVRNVLGGMETSGIGGGSFSIQQSIKSAVVGILPLAEYGISVWGPTRHLKKVEAAWDETCRRIAGLHRGTNATILQAVVKLPMLRVRYLAAIAKLFFRVARMKEHRVLHSLIRAREAQQVGLPPGRQRNAFWISHALNAFAELGIDLGVDPWESLRNMSIFAFNKCLKLAAQEYNLKLWRKKCDLECFQYSAVFSTAIFREVEFTVNNVECLRSCILAAPRAVRIFLLLLITSSLPLQSCRKACLGSRQGGFGASTLCLLCSEADENMHHFFFHCTPLNLSRNLLVQYRGVTEVCEQVAADLISNKVSPLIMELGALWKKRNDYLARKNIKAV